MIKSYILWLLLVITILSSCKQDDNPTEEVCKLWSSDLVSGLSLYDANGQSLGIWQSPNDYSTEESEIQFYPNPCVDVLALNGGSGLIKLWVVPSDCDAACSEEKLDLSQTPNSIVTQSELDDRAVLTGEFQISGTLNLELRNTEEGFHKLYVEQENGNLSWYNLFISAQPTPSMEIFDLLDAQCSE